MSITEGLSKFIAIASVLLMTGCASINKALPSVEAESKQFKENSEASQVYVYRNEAFGGAISMPVTVDGKWAGNTGPHSFFKFDLPAGEHTITSQGGESRITLTTELGKLYYVWQEVKMGAFSAGSKLQLVSDDLGRKGVAECTQAQSAF